MLVGFVNRDIQLPVSATVLLLHLNLQIWLCVVFYSILRMVASAFATLIILYKKIQCLFVDVCNGGAYAPRWLRWSDPSHNVELHEIQSGSLSTMNHLLPLHLLPRTARPPSAKPSPPTSRGRRTTVMPCRPSQPPPPVHRPQLAIPLTFLLCHRPPPLETLT
jgi:hypothetical protein